MKFNLTESQRMGLMLAGMVVFAAVLGLICRQTLIV